MPKVNIVETFAVDDTDNLWVSRGEGGVWVYDHETRQWANLAPKNSALIDKYITSIVIDQKNRVWIGCHGGLTVFDGKDSGYWGTITPGVTMQPGTVNELRRAKRNNEAPFPNLNYPTVARQVVLDSRGRLWAWSGNGVSVFVEE